MDFDGPLLNDRWRLGPRLGKGGQGNTYLVRDERGGRGAGSGAGKVAVLKRLELRGESWKKFDLFEREVRVLKQLDHPGIPKYLDHFEDTAAGTFYLVMQRARGRDLRALERTDEAGLRDVMDRALDILGYLHDRRPPVIHRDIKPANLVRATDGSLSLVDFGGVRDVIRETGGSTVVGTFGYMAPEQLHGQATPATDLYGLGATIATLAGGVEPEAIPRRGLRMDLKRHLPQLSPKLVDLLERMTAPDPDDRPQSAKQVQRALRELPDPAREGRKRRRRRSSSDADADARPLPAVREPDTPAHTPDDSHDTALVPLDASVPAPIRWLLYVLLWAVGTAGFLGLSVIRSLLLPVLFTVIGAFASTESRARLRSAHDRASAVLDDGRRGFRRLASSARKQRKQLPPKRSES